MKVYLAEVLVYGFDDATDAPSVKYHLENCRYLATRVLSIKESDITDWDDDHPLNNTKTAPQEVKEYFSEK